MPMLIIQLAILIAVAFVIGCVWGRLFRGKKSTANDKEDTIIAAALSSPAIDEKPEPVAPSEAEVVGGETEPVIEAEAQATNASEEEVTPPEAESVVADEQALVEEAFAVVEDPDRPELLDAPIRGKPDNLTAINGVGKAVEGMLQQLGVFHYAQIAKWSTDEAAWIERRIGFAGRVSREGWIAQAGKLVETSPSGTSKRGSKAKKAAPKPKAAPRTKKTQA
ncbi:endonuclease [Brucella sp. NBRC 12950]|uniref:endonuclease n=1 Tax=Brucella sp. NBRC 12950 TaxID=2994518 RepID=UPI0024A301CA|nr:endonuclease [Brucella sp. NBRC 12950]GLU26982.1 hypothetical protein Brsp01_22150 [Brucella sp. NBRC 12950]